MRTPKYNPETYHPQQSYSARQLSRYDMEIAGVVIYVIAMAVIFVVALVFMLFGEGSVTQAQALSKKAAIVMQRNKSVVAETAAAAPARTEFSLAKNVSEQLKAML
jgi:hypothetical protein